ncbi:hypothetical protein S40293_09494 [Stachybotrys chartarum IBT 40293]|nr:hypothetical protein S40293_09494 [Stachybotrys chartarum IBT 40293]
MPHQDDNSPIEVHLFDYLLQGSRKGTHLYEALSYVWGSKEKPYSVSTDKGDLPVTTNLYMALKRLRDQSLARVIWVDAICIDQDNMEERNRQVQSMAKIYAQASRVIVWLGEVRVGYAQVHREALLDNDQGLEELRAAADAQPTNSSDGEMNQRAILSVLQQSWFQRIWVLQEAAAARQILIVSDSAEIDGYTFCLGLNASKATFQDRDTQSRIRSAAYLIKGAVFRSKYVATHLERFSLNIRPLGELIDMYHNRQATDRRDKVYALLGMSSDVSVGLSPDYDISWKDLFYRLVKSLVGAQASVETWEEREIAVITANGCILGEVSLVESDGDWNDTQSVHIVSKNTRQHSAQKKGWTCCWTLHTTAKSIRKGDAVCLLQGASKPMIVRLYNDYCAIIAISVTPTSNVERERSGVDWPELLGAVKIFRRDFLIVWNWEDISERMGDKKADEWFENSQVPRHTKPESERELDEASRLRNTGLILADLERCEAAEWNLLKAMDVHIRVSGSLEHMVHSMDDLALVCRGLGDSKRAYKLKLMANMLGQRGDYSQITEEIIARVARSAGPEIMALLLNQRGDEVKITESVVKAAAGNESSGQDVMSLLLNQRGDEVKIIESVVKAAAGNETSGQDIISLLLNQRNNEVKITEGVVKVCGDEVKIIESVVKAAAGN